MPVPLASPAPVAVPAIATGDLAPELAWLAACGVEVVATVGGGRRVDGERVPRLHLVAEGERPPRCGELEDWVRLPVDRDELLVRAERLLARAHPPAAPTIDVDGDGVVRCGGQIAIVGPQEAALLRLLVASGGRLVARASLVEQLWPDGAPHDPRALDNRVKALRQHLRAVPVRIHTVRGRGFLLEVAPTA